MVDLLYVNIELSFKGTVSNWSFSPTLLIILSLPPSLTSLIINLCFSYMPAALLFSDEAYPLPPPSSRFLIYQLTLIACYGYCELLYLKLSVPMRDDSGKWWSAINTLCDPRFFNLIPSIDLSLLSFSMSSSTTISISLWVKRWWELSSSSPWSRFSASILA